MRLKSAEAIPKAISMNVARVTVPIWQSVTASQRKLYLIPATAGGNARNHARRDHNHQRAIALAIAAGDARDSREQDVRGFGRVLLIENDAALFNPAHRQRIGKSVQLARREPGNVLKSP